MISKELNLEEQKLVNHSIKRHFGFDILRILACYMVIQIHTGEFYHIGDGGTVLNHHNFIGEIDLTELAPFIKLFAIMQFNRNTPASLGTQVRLPIF